MVDAAHTVENAERRAQRVRPSVVASGAHALVAFSVGFGLWVLRAETTPVPNLNDSSVHTSMIRWAEQRIANGRTPFDGWFPNFQFGSAHFRHYQSLPHVVTGALARIVGADHAFSWTLYLLLATWPISIYIASRMFGWGLWVAGCAAMIAPVLVSLPGYGLEHGSFVWQGYGLWAMLWGSWTLPIAWALGWQAVAHGRHRIPAILAIAVTLGFHFVAGYVALIALPVFVAIQPRELGRRLARSLVIGGGALVVASWAVVPLVADSRWISSNEAEQGTYFTDSHGARDVVAWLSSGSLYDEGRFPVVTILVAIGFLACALRVRQDERARALLALWSVNLAMFFGRPTLKGWTRLFPGEGDLLFSRFIIGVHLSGILLAAVGVVSVVRFARAASCGWLPRSRTLGNAVTIAVVIVMSIPAWTQIASYNARGAEYIREQQRADDSDGADLAHLLERIKSEGGGRAYAGMLNNWGWNYRVGQVPVFAILEHADIDTIGFNNRAASLMRNVEPYFDDTRLSEYDLFGVSYLLLPVDQPPPVPAVKIDERGRHVLWRLAGHGYVSVVDSIAPISADRTTLGVRMAALIHSGLNEQRLLPTVDYDDVGGVPTLSPAVLFDDHPGFVLRQDREINDGHFTTRVIAKRTSVVVLKASFDPRWRVEVDGHTAPTEMIAPAYVGVTVGAGQHDIEFWYDPDESTYAWLALAAIAIVTLALVPQRNSFRARRWLDRRARVALPRTEDLDDQ